MLLLWGLLVKLWKSWVTQVWCRACRWMIWRNWCWRFSLQPSQPGFCHHHSHGTFLGRSPKRTFCQLISLSIPPSQPLPVPHSILFLLHGWAGSSFSNPVLPPASTSRFPCTGVQLASVLGLCVSWSSHHTGDFQYRLEPLAHLEIFPGLHSSISQGPFDYSIRITNNHLKLHMMQKTNQKNNFFSLSKPASLPIFTSLFNGVGVIYLVAQRP